MHKEQQRQHLKSNNNVISKLAVIVLSIVLITGISLVPTLQIGAYGQLEQQPQQEKFFMIMKLGKPEETTPDYVSYEVYDMMTSMKNFNQGKKVDYNLIDVYVTISDSSIYWTLPFKVIDTDTPNIIKTRNGEIGISTLTQDYEK